MKLKPPKWDEFAEFFAGSEGREVSTTMAFVRLLARLMRDKNVGRYVVPIIPVMCLTPSWPWLWLSGTVALSYLFFAQTPWQVPLWVTGVEFIPLSAGLVMLGWRWRAAPRGLRQAPAWRKQA